MVPLPVPNPAVQQAQEASTMGAAEYAGSFIPAALGS